MSISGLKYSMMSGRLWSVLLMFSCFPCLPLKHSQCKSLWTCAFWTLKGSAHCTTATPDLHYCEVTSSNHPCKFKSRASGLDAVTTRHAPHATQPSILCFSEYSKVNLGLKNLMLSMRLPVLCCLCPSCFWIRRKQSFTCWKKGSGNEDKFLDLVEKTREVQFGLVGLWFQTKVLAWPAWPICGLRMLASN